MPWCHLAELGCVRSLCQMYDCLATRANGVVPGEGEAYLRSIELWFLYSLVWSVAATVDEEGRREVDSLMRELDAQV